MFAFGAQRAVVEVDEDLGLVRVVQLASALDVGKAMNPQGVEGQSEGGSAQGLGLAVMEEILLRDGAIANASFTDYLIPTMLDMPPVVTAIVEDPEPDVPYGAKGVGEISTIVSTAAIVAAMRDATGLELNRAPGAARRRRRASRTRGGTVARRCRRSRVRNRCPSTSARISARNHSSRRSSACWI